MTNFSHMCSPRPYGWQYWRSSLWYSTDMNKAIIKFSVLASSTSSQARTSSSSSSDVTGQPNNYSFFKATALFLIMHHQEGITHHQGRPHIYFRKPRPSLEASIHTVCRRLYFSLFFKTFMVWINRQGHCSQINFLLAGHIQETYSDLRIIQFVCAALHNTE